MGNTLVRDLRHPGLVTVPSGLDVLAGVWLLMSPFVLIFRNAPAIANPDGAITSDFLLGITIAGLAVIRASVPAKYVAVSWVNFALGILVFASPWMMGFGRLEVAVVNNICTGVIMVILAAWSAIATHSGERMSPY